MEPTFRSPFSYGISNSSKRLPRNGLLLYLARPNSDEYLIGEDTEIGEDTYIWGYVLPDDSDIRSATGWVNGTANVFYTATGVPIVALAKEIAAAILPANVVFSLVDATTQTGKLAIYTDTTTEVTLDKARSVLRDESINRLFYGVNGIWYDPQDLTTMYQDHPGTLPVYRPGTGLVDPPVGLSLDKSRGLELGPELVVNGDFSGGATGWTVTGTDATHYVTFADGAARFVSDTTTPALSLQQINLYTPNRWYFYEIDIRTAVSGSVKIEVPGAQLTISSAGKTTGFLYHVGTTLTITRASVNTDITIDSISVHEIKGYHAYQSTTLARPTLSGRYNLLTATETLSTQSVTVAATDYTLRFEGTGSIALSGTATGTYTAGTHTITCTAGTLTCTVSGSVTKADLRVKRNGSSLPAYQSVTNANTYDTAGFSLFLKRDRVDDDLTMQAPAIAGQTAWGSIDTVAVAAATIAAGAYQPFGTIISGEPTCTQWIAIDGALSAAEQAALERYVYSKSKLPVGV